MKIMKFRTNIENDEQVALIAPALDKEPKISKWNLATDNQDHLLSVSGEEITPEVVTKPIHDKGFEAELIHVLAIGGHDL
jgi:copper chaperone